jgi:hypothetical protein
MMSVMTKLINNINLIVSFWIFVYNVISNFPFLLVGIYAIILLKNNKLDISDNIKYMYYTMFFGVVMIFMWHCILLL